jgi:1-acyl-sn-glycerol-3-phosphate acyltransferase
MPTETLNNLFDPRESKRYYFDETLFRKVATPTLKFLFSLFATTQANDLENFPIKGPVVLIANHMSFYDMFPMQFILQRPIFFMAKAELHKNPLLDGILRQLGSFPVNREARDNWAMEHARELLLRDQVLGIFPEGTRNRGRGLRPAKTGAARLAISADCPIIPMAVIGTEAMFKNLPRRSQVTINVGTPIYPQQSDTVLEFTDRMMFSLAELLPVRLRGVYAQHPRGF